MNLSKRILSLTTPLALAATAQAQLIGEVLIYGFHNEPVGQAVLDEVGGELVVSNIGASGDDGVLVHVPEGDGVRVSAPLDPAMPLGATMRSEVRAEVAGVPDSSTGTVGLQRTPTGYLALADFNAIGSPTYDARIFLDDAVVHSASALSRGMIELVPGPGVQAELECHYFIEGNLWIWIGEPIIQFRDHSTGISVTGNRIELRPSDSVPPASGPLQLYILAQAMPQMTILNEAVAKLGSFHTGGEGTELSTCSDCLVVSNIGSSGDGLGGRLTLSNIGATADDPGPAAQQAEAELFLFTDAEPGTSVEVSGIAASRGIENDAGTLKMTRLGDGRWEVQGHTGGIQVLMGDGAVHDDDEPGLAGVTIYIDEMPQRVGGDAAFFFDGEVWAGLVLRFAAPLPMTLPSGATVVGDGLRFAELALSPGDDLELRRISILYDGAEVSPDVTPLFKVSGVSSLLAESYCSATPNSSGQPAFLLADGSTSVSANDLVLRAGPVPNQFGVFFYGPDRIEVPFGNGNLCVGGQVHRLDVELASGNVLTHALDNTDPPGAHCQILAGSNWNCQAWFRDPAGGGAAFNLSNALSLSFQP